MHEWELNQIIKKQHSPPFFLKLKDLKDIYKSSRSPWVRTVPAAQHEAADLTVKSNQGSLLHVLQYFN